MEEDISQAQLAIISMMLLFCGFSNVAIVWRILKKNWKELRPIHVYQINYFTGLSLVSFSGLMVILGDPLSYRGICPGTLLSYFFSINYIYDIFILQLDRLTAVRKPFFYKNRVHAGLSVKVVVCFKVISVFITAVATFIDPVFLHCPVCNRCIYVHSINVYTVAYPSFAAIILTIGVSIYVSIKTYKLNSIQPIVSMPKSNMNKQKVWTTPESQNAVTIRPRRRFSSPTEESREGTYEEEIEEINIINMIKQLDQKTHPANKKQIIHNDEVQNLRKAAVIQTERTMMKKTLKMNLLTLALLFIVVPIQILTIVYENCDESKGECDNYFSSMIVISLLQLIIGCLHPIIVIIILELNG